MSGYVPGRCIFVLKPPIIRSSRSRLLLPIRNVSTFRYFPVHNAEERSNAISELRQRVKVERDCLGYMIESFITNISVAEKSSQEDVIDLLKACKQDIVDLSPKAQQRITENAWDAVRKVEILGERNPLMYNITLEAFLFQNIKLDKENFTSEMEYRQIYPNLRTLENFLIYHCQNKDIDEAVNLLESSSQSEQLHLNSRIASALIHCHCSRGEFDEADSVVDMLDKRQIYYGKGVPNAFVTGTAKHGNIDRLKEYIELYSPQDQVLLQALHELCLVSPTEASVVLDLLPVNRENMSSLCRRTVKQLVELNQLDIAETLVHKMEERPENTSKKEQATSISPSVIVLSEILERETDPFRAIKRIYAMKAVDSRIIERCMVRLFDLCMEQPHRKPYCQDMIKGLLRENPKVFKAAEVLYSQNVARRIKETREDNKILFILKTTSDLGIKLTHNKEWTYALERLISQEEEHTVTSLIARIKYIRECMDCMTGNEGGVYSNSVLWSQIIKYLLSVKSDLFFKATAGTITGLGVAYGPRRWYDHLGYSLVYTEDVRSFVDILQAAYSNCEKRGDGEDYRQVCIGLLVAINVCKKNGENLDQLLDEVFDEIWKRNLLIPPEIRDRIVESLDSNILAEAARNLPVLGPNNFRSARAPGARKSHFSNKKKRKNRNNAMTEE